MKDLFHYFGQSPQSDESASSLKENEASSAPVQEKSEVNRASSSDVLKCKTTGYNLNTKEEHPVRSQTDFIDKAVKTIQAGKRKSVAKKKPSASDEDFKVKSTPKTVRRRNKPQQKTKAEKVLPDSGPTQHSSMSEDEISRSNVPTAIEEQPVTSPKEATVVSTSPDDSVTENKPKSGKNILHFFNPAKCTDVQPEQSGIEVDKTGLQGESFASDFKGESITESKEENKSSKKARVKKACQKLKENLESGDLSNTPKEGKKKVDTKKKEVSVSKCNAADAKNTTELVQSASELCNNDMKSSVCNAFQMLMSKKLDSCGPTLSSSNSKAEEGSCFINTEDDASFENTPRLVLKRKKRNRIESDTEDDELSGFSSQQKKKVTEVDETNSQEESGKKSLMKYFSKLTKAEAEIQSQKVQFKVEALVHHSDGSPYKSKSKMEARSKQKNIKKRKTKQTNNENEIEWLGSEEITVVNNPSPKPESVDAHELNPRKDDNYQEDETKTAEVSKKNSVTKAKRSLKLNSSRSTPSKAKRLKKASEPVENEKTSTEPSEGSIEHTEPPHIKVSCDVAIDPTESSPPIITKTPGKKLKQVSLMDQFVRKPCNDATASKVAETTKDCNKNSSPSTSFVKLDTMSSSALDTKKKTPLKSKQRKSSFESEQSKSTTHVVSAEEDALKNSPQEPSFDSPFPPKQSSSDNVTPNIRTWKMRVCLTPKPGTSHTNLPVVFPNTADAVSGDDYDVQEIAIVKKKKKKAKSKSTDSEVKESPEKEIEIIYEEKDSRNSSKAAVKLAPLFKRPKKPDPIAEQAKLEFLQSGVPEQVRKMIEVQKSMECTEVELFPLISHVTQLDKDLPWTPSEGHLTLKAESPESDPAPSESLKMGDMTTCDPLGCDMAEVLSNCSTSLHRQKRRIAMEHVPAVLSLIRAEDNSFEVIQNFKTLQEKYRKVLDPETSAALMSKSDFKGRKRSRSTRRSRSSNQNVNSPKPMRNISNLMWTDKYRPTTSDAIIGNKMSVLNLKRWLESLRKISQARQMPVAKAKKPKKNDYEDDFVLSDGSCDSDSCSAFRSNSALLVGCHGSGKTNCVYALAADLDYKVLEINASERRSGKIILAKLSEATQSHQVANRSQEHNPSAANFFSPKNSKPKGGKRKIEKKPEAEEESTQNKLSLILIKDIDVVFEEEDEGFVSAVASLVSTSKRPVIFTTTDGNCLNVRRIVNSSTELFEFIPDKKALCSWLQTIALVEGVYVSRDALDDLLSACREDVRQCLLQLQVWMSTGGNHLSEPPATRDNDSVQKQEETRLKEFLLADITEGDLDADVNWSSLTAFEHHDCIGALQGRNDVELGKENSRVTIPSPVQLGRVWWNVPHLLSLPQVPVPELVLPEALEQPRRFKGLFDDSIFDVTSDDEDLTNSQPLSSQPTSSQPMDSQPTDSQLGNSQPMDSEEENVSPVENVVEPVENDFGHTQAFDVRRCTQGEVDAMLSHMQAMSTCDLISTASSLQESADDFEPIPRYWRISPRDSLSQTTPVMEGPNLLVENTSRSMCHWLAENSIEHARTVLLQNSQSVRFNALLPDREIKRRRLTVADAESAALRVVATCAQLQRSAIALDYLPTLRRISASQQRRADTSRRNRFYHYFKKLNMDITPNQTTILSST